MTDTETRSRRRRDLREIGKVLAVLVLAAVVLDWIQSMRGRFDGG